MNRFTAMRKRAGYTQGQVAERLSLNQSTIAKWETGESYPRFSTLLSLCELYACSIDELAGTSNEKGKAV